ncbi:MULTISPECIES: GPP34 family phosphoprotein [Bacillota]|uniref:GPP34 family phosphoprotein n=1 Tax=Bacillota TaxID=1239 RepID=UPI00096AB5FF|nr:MULTISPECIES: GPP34 family phosphoprotein [Bacillota]PWX35492.1 GPP34 family phosphoprotein [Clostridium perfringens]
MKDLSITQEYLICAVNSKGKISGFGSEKLICLIASGLLELQLEDCIKIDKKRVTVTNNLPDEKLYLKPLYDFVNQQKPVKLEKILEAYNYSFKDRGYELVNTIGASLKDLGLVEVTRTGIFGNKNAYIPNANAVHYVVDMIRAEFLEDVEVTEDIASLIILLDKSKVLKTYFSEYEQKEIKKKLKEITNSDTGKSIKDMVNNVEYMITMMNVLIVAYS